MNLDLMTKKVTMMVMSHLNMMIVKTKTTERTLTMMMLTRRARKSLAKKERKRYEKRRNHLKNSIKTSTMRERKTITKMRIAPQRYQLPVPIMMTNDFSR